MSFEIEDIRQGMSADDQRAAAKEILSVLRDEDAQPVPLTKDERTAQDDRISAILSKSPGDLTKDEVTDLQSAIRECLNGGGNA